MAPVDFKPHQYLVVIIFKAFLKVLSAVKWKGLKEFSMNQKNTSIHSYFNSYCE